MADLDNGTVTFLFTDIEGSTRRWEQHPELMPRALARHDAILRDAIEGHGGTVFKTVGDAFCAAFLDASDALAACVDAQRAVESEPWSGQCTIRVRMALHAGPAHERDGDYFGPTVNRVARLLAAGHGGQTLLSGAVKQVLEGLVPAQVGFLDLGAHRLKDLTQPERIFQVVVPGLPSEFPALRVLDAHPTNLPVLPTPFVGRRREIAAASALLRRRDVRLATFTGPAGTGKTRLSLQVAAELSDDFSDGVFFVPLATIADPGLVASTIATVLGLKEVASRPVLDTLRDHLRDRRLLLVLDNFEQVADAAPVVADLLESAPSLKVLVTSQVVLRVYGEHDYPVLPLSLPAPNGAESVGDLARYEAIELFVQRARAAKGDFELTCDNARAVADICRRLDGLPLAIELAAARTRLLPPQAILARLSSRLALLTGGARTLPTRQQTLRGAIDWSYGLLDEGERALFTRLGVFAGGCRLEAVEPVCRVAGDLAIDVLEGMTSLLDKSLLRQTEDPDGEPRFHMYATIQEYALEQLAARNETETVRGRHAQYLLDLAEAAPRLVGEQQVRWLKRLENEHDNLRAALDWALSRGHRELALRLSGTLWRFWETRGHLAEGRRWLEAALTDPTGVATWVLTRALDGAGILAQRQGDFGRAAELHERSLALRRESNDTFGIAMCLNSLGNVATGQGRYERAQELHEESLALYREIGDKFGIAWTLQYLGQLAMSREDYPRALRVQAECLALRREIGDPFGIALSSNALADATLAVGDCEGAASLYRQAIDICRELGYDGGIATSLEGLACAAAAEGSAERAAALFAAAEKLRDALHMPLSPVRAQRHERFLDLARARVGEVAWAEAWTRGRTLSLDGIVDAVRKHQELVSPHFSAQTD